MSSEPNSPKEIESQEASEEALREQYFASLKKQFIMLPMGIMCDVEKGKLTPTDACLYAYLLAKAGENGVLWWPNWKLELLSRFNLSTIKLSLNKLENAGYIRRDTVREGDRDQRYIHPLLWVEEGGEIIFGRSKGDAFMAERLKHRRMPRRHETRINTDEIPFKIAA